KFKGEKGEPSSVPGPEGKPGRDADVAKVVQLAEDRTREWLNNTLHAAIKSAIQELGDLRGPAGTDGKSIVGPAGRDGVDGKSIVGPGGRNGRDGKDSIIPGPKGDTGEPGRDGKDSIIPGPKGEPGKDSTVTLEEVEKLI